MYRVDEWGNEIENLVTHPYGKPETTEEIDDDQIIEDFVSKALAMIQIDHLYN